MITDFFRFSADSDASYFIEPFCSVFLLQHINHTKGFEKRQTFLTNGIAKNSYGTFSLIKISVCHKTVSKELLDSLLFTQVWGKPICIFLYCFCLPRCVKIPLGEWVNSVKLGISKLPNLCLSAKWFSLEVICPPYGVGPKKKCRPFGQVCFLLWV